MASSTRPGCGYARRRLWELLDEELPAMEAWYVERHVASCPRCGRCAVLAKRLLDRIARIREGR